MADEDFQMDVTGAGDDDDLTEQPSQAHSKSASKKNSTAGSSLAVNSDGTRRRSVNSLKRRSEFADDDAREKTHLRDANEALLKNIERMNRELDELKQQRRGELSANDRKSIEEVEEENKVIEQSNKKLREKLQQVSDIELLDRLQDQLAEKQVQLRTLELRKRTLQEEHRTRSKVLDTLLEKGPKNPQAMFHDMKQERKRHQTRLDKNRERCEKMREAIEAMRVKADEQQKKEQELGLNEVEKDEILALQKRDAEQKKEMDLLQRKTHVLGGTFNARTKHSQWHAKDLSEEVRGLQGQVRHWETQIVQLEQTIMANQGLSTKPTHFLQPLEMQEVRDAPSPPKQPREARTNPHSARVANSNKNNNSDVNSGADPTSKPEPATARKPAPKKKPAAASSPAPAKKFSTKKPQPPPKDPAATKPSKQQHSKNSSGEAFARKDQQRSNGSRSSRSSSRSSARYSTDSYSNRSPSSSPERGAKTTNNDAQQPATATKEESRDDKTPTPPPAAEQQQKPSSAQRTAEQEPTYEEDGQLRNLDEDSFDDDAQQDQQQQQQHATAAATKTPTPPPAEEAPKEEAQQADTNDEENAYASDEGFEDEEKETQQPKDEDETEKAAAPAAASSSLVAAPTMVDWAMLREKMPTEKTDEGKAKRRELFDLFDPNGNGYLSLAEVDKGCRDVLQLHDIFNAKPVIMRAFQASKDVGSRRDKPGDRGADYVEFREFRLLLVYLRQYFEIWQMFDQVDTSDDRRINFDEFCKALPLLQEWGVTIDDPQGTFDTIDQNGGGQILFDEFSAWALEKGLDLADDDD